jgi:hypothetical protein
MLPGACLHRLVGRGRVLAPFIRQCEFRGRSIPVQAQLERRFALLGQHRRHEHRFARKAEMRRSVRAR